LSAELIKMHSFRLLFLPTGILVNSYIYI